MTASHSSFIEVPSTLYRSTGVYIEVFLLLVQNCSMLLTSLLTCIRPAQCVHSLNLLSLSLCAVASNAFFLLIECVNSVIGFLSADCIVVLVSYAC